MDWVDYREKLGLGFSDEEKVALFYTRMSNVLNGLVEEGCINLSFEEYYSFCQDTGSHMNVSLSDEYRGSARFRDCIRIIRAHEKCFEEYLSYFVWLINSIDKSNKSPWDKETFKNILKKCLSDSRINYEVLEADGKFYIFPKGAEELDIALVNEPLSWLVSYSKAHTAYIKALKEYSEATPENASDIADKFRKTLETFLREFFGNSASLEKNKIEYGRYLKATGVPSEISGNLETLLQTYANFMNGYAKHRDATSLNVLEYIMYQTGNIIRLLITLNQAKVNQTEKLSEEQNL